MPSTGGDHIAKPALYQKEPFDPINSQLFRFSYQGAQAHANRLVIKEYDSDNLEPVYDTIQETLRLEHVVPGGNTLARNKRYVAYVSVMDRSGQWTSQSEPMIFWCFGTPRFQFELGGVVIPGTQTSYTTQNSSLEVGLYYNQSGHEGLNSYRIDLYDSQGQLVQKGTDKLVTGDIRYDTTDPRVTIRGLEDNERYFIQAVGVTDHGMRIQTTKLALNVEYEHPTMFSLIDVENIEKNATIRIHSNLQRLEGTCSAEYPKYIDNERIDLTAFGHYVRFEDGFNLTGDFTLYLMGQNLIPYHDVLEIANGSNSITLRYMRGWFNEQLEEQAYFVLTVGNGVNSYELTSNYFDVPYSDDSIYIWIQRRENYYSLQCCVLEGDHQNTSTREFDVYLSRPGEWDKVIVEGYMNVDMGRLEF